MPSPGPSPQWKCAGRAGAPARPASPLPRLPPRRPVPARWARVPSLGGSSETQSAPCETKRWGRGPLVARFCRTRRPALQAPPTFPGHAHTTSERPLCVLGARTPSPGPGRPAPHLWHRRCRPGTAPMQRMRAEQTAMQASTSGSARRLSRHTWPTYPSLLHTHTSGVGSGQLLRVGAAHENCGKRQRIGEDEWRNCCQLHTALQALVGVFGFSTHPLHTRAHIQHT